MELNPDIWGTYADWVGGVGTTLAFFAAVFVIAKDAKVRKIAQARKVAYVAEVRTVYRETDAWGVTHPEEVTYYILKNLSDEPIYRCFFYAHNGRKAGRAIDSKDVVLPGDEFVYGLGIDEPPLACFRDNSDVGWVRNIKGKIHAYKGRAFAVDSRDYGE